MANKIASVGVDARNGILAGASFNAEGVSKNVR
jgi:hypothetical protein